MVVKRFLGLSFDREVDDGLRVVREQFKICRVINEARSVLSRKFVSGRELCEDVELGNLPSY